MKDRLLSLYATAMDSGFKEYFEMYNTLLVKAVKECLKTKDDSLFRDIAIETEYDTQYESMVKIRKELFGYNEEEVDSLIYAM